MGITDTSSIKLVTDGTLYEDVLCSPLPVLLDLWADWCGPCHLIAPVVEELARTYEGRVKVATLDVDSNPQVTAQYGIRSIPTLLLFKDGQVVDQIIGVVPKSELVERIDANLQTGHARSE